MSLTPGPGLTPATASVEFVEQRLRQIAAEDGRGLDYIDQFLLSLTQVFGAEFTDRVVRSMGEPS